MMSSDSRTVPDWQRGNEHLDAEGAHAGGMLLGKKCRVEMGDGDV